jgi:lipopolysaccharide export system permease protein
MRDQYQRRSDIERVSPGEFRESAGRLRVFFIDKDAPDSATASNVFISSIERNLQIITSAQSGRIEDIGEARYLMLSNGQRLERPLTPGELKISEFRSYGAKVGSDIDTSNGAAPVRAKTTLTLLREPSATNRGELAWRIGMVLAAINFVVLALTVSSANPRVGRSGNLLFALCAFVLYYNLLNLGQNWVGMGRYGMAGFMVALHGGAMVLGLVWLAKRHFNWSWRLLPARRRSPESSPT